MENTSITNESSTSYEKLNKEIIKLVYAGFWVRLLAFTIDILLINAIYNLFANPILALTRLKSTGFIFTVFYLIVYLGYFVLTTKFTNGQTIGKMILNLRVVSFQEDVLSWKTLLTRELFGRYIQYVILLLYLIVPFNSKKQHLADFLSDTTVIKENLYELFIKEKERSVL